MKILLLQDYLRSGGTERQSILLANAFAAAGHEATLLTFRPGGTLAKTISANVRHRALQSFDLGLDWFAPGLRSEVRAIQPQVALCMGRMANCRAALVEKQCPTVATMRTGKPLPWLFRRSLARVSCVVANSQEARDTLVHHYHVAPEKIRVIHNSLVFPPDRSSADENRAEREAVRQRHGASPTTCVLLCVAMFRPEKNQRELIETAASLPRDFDWQLWLAGDGPARQECENIVARNGLASRVKFLGFHRDPSPLYTAADIAVHASWSEALSNFIIEAQAHGLPAVAYEAQGMCECFVPDRTGWAIVRSDRVAFAAAVQRVAALTAPARAAVAEAAKTYARQTFDPAVQVDAYLDLLQTIAVSGRP